jgi:hypothetical protein
MNWNALMGVASTFALFVPVGLILILRLYSNRPLLALLFYYLSTAIYHLMVEGIIPASAEATRIYGTINNYTDAPLMLLFFHFFTADKIKSRALHILLALFLVYELIIAGIFGVERTANVYILAPCVCVNLIFGIILFIRHGRLAITHGKGIGKTLMLSAVVFSYGSFAIIYIFHYLLKINARADIFLLYFITSTLTSLIMAIGITFTQKHLRQLEEVKLARKELRMFFNT